MGFLANDRNLEKQKKEAACSAYNWQCLIIIMFSTQCTTCNYLLRCRYVFVWKAALVLGLGKLGHPASMPWYRNLSQQHFRHDCSVHSFFALTWNVQYCCLFIALFCSFLARCEQRRTLTKERKPPIIRACIMRKRHYSTWSQVFGFLPRLQGDQKHVHETTDLPQLPGSPCASDLRLILTPLFIPWMR